MQWNALFPIDIRISNVKNGQEAFTVTKASWFCLVQRNLSSYLHHHLGDSQWSLDLPTFLLSFVPLPEDEMFLSKHNGNLSLMCLYLVISCDTRTYSGYST